MPAKVGQLELDFLVNLAQFQGDLNKSVAATKKAANEMQRSMSDAAKGIALSLATVGAVELFKGLLDNVSDAQNQMAQVQASLKSTGGAAGVTAGQIDELARSIKKMSSYDDDAIKGMDAILLTFTKVGKDVFPQATQAIVDMSAKLKQDLKSSAIQVGKALNDPIKGLTALQRVGVSFSETQKAMIKSMVESGKTMDAQKIILRELATEFGGSAAAARNTLGGALDALKISIADTYKAIGGDGSSLRLGVETLIVVMEKATSVITDMSNPTTAIGKDMKWLGKTFGDTTETIIVWLNTAIYASSLFGHALGDGIQEAIATLQKWDKSLEKSAMGDWYKKLKEQIEAPFKYFADADAKYKQAYKSGAMPDYFKGIKDIIAEAKKNMDDLNKASSKYKGPGHSSGGEGGISAEEQKKLDKQRQTLQDILDSYQARNRAVAAQTIEEKALNDQLEVEHRISGLTNIPLKERLAALLQIKAATKERIDIENQAEIDKQRNTLEEILATRQKELQVSQNKTKDQDELNILLAAEEEIRKATKDHASANLDIQNHILDVAKQQMEVAKQEKHDAALKTLQGISKEYDDEYQSILDQINGRKRLNKLEEDSLKIQQTKGLSEKEKADAIAALTAKQGQISALNTQYQQQEQLVNDIISADASHADKVKALQQAYDASKISAKGWADGMNSLGKSSKDATGAAQSFVSILSNGLNNIFSGGQKVTDVFKSMGKELLQLATKTLFLDPLEKGLTKLAGTLFGGGSSSNAATANANLPPGVFRTPSGQYTTDPNYNTYWPSALQNSNTSGSSSGSLASSTSGSGILGGLLGGALGLLGLSKGGAKGLKGLSGALTSATGAPAGVGAPDPSIPVDDAVLLSGYQALRGSTWRSNMKDALGNPLQDYEAYAKMPRLQAQKLLGVAMPGKTSSSSGILNSLFGSPLSLTGLGAGAGIASLGSLFKRGNNSGGPQSKSDPFSQMVDLLTKIDTNLKKIADLFAPETPAAPTSSGILGPALGDFLSIPMGSQGIASTLGNATKKITSSITDMVQKFTDSIKSSFTSLFSPISNIFSKLFSGNNGIIGSITSGLSSLVSGIGNLFKNGFNVVDSLMGSRGSDSIDYSDPSSYNFSANRTPDGFGAELARIQNENSKAIARQWIASHPDEMSAGGFRAQMMARQADQGASIGGYTSQDIYNAGGRVGWAAGDQHMAMLRKAIALGVPVPPKLMAYAQFEDDRWSSTGMSAGMFSALSYNSMGMGGGTYGGNSSATAYAAGRNEGFDHSQWGKMVGQNYIGASDSYLNNIKSWNTHSGIGPGANSSITGDTNIGSAPMAGFGGRSSEYRINPDGSLSPIQRGPGSYKHDGAGGYQFVPSFDPTVPSSQYQPESGTVRGLQADWNKNALYSALSTFDVGMKPGTLSVSNTRNDVFEGNYSAPVNAYWAQKQVAPFYKPSTDAFTAGQINGLMLGGGRANGGNVSKNTLYQVNERGDEMFVPDSAGKIYPLKNGTGSSGAKVTVHNYAGVDVQQQPSHDGRDVTFILKSLTAQDNVTGYGARILASKYGLQQTPARRG